MGKYDVIQTGNINLEYPSFWKAASDVLEKYLDPEYQNRLINRKKSRIDMKINLLKINRLGLSLKGDTIRNTNLRKIREYWKINSMKHNRRK